MSKVTLHVPEQLVAAAKQEAARRKVSVSKLVSDFFSSLAAAESRGVGKVDTKLAPRTSRLAGCIPDADERDYMAHLEQKHS